MNYQQINENWQRYQQVEALLENRAYITGVLGVQLPLNESGEVILSEELKEQILQEELLLKKFVDTLVKRAKKAGRDLKNLYLSFAKILKNPDKIEEFMSIVRQKVIKVDIRKTRIIINNLKANPKAARIVTFLEGILTKLGEFYNWLKGLNTNWKNAMVTASVSVLIKYLFEKFIDKMKDLSGVTDKFLEEAGKFVLTKLAPDFASAIISKLVDVKTWLAWLGPIVGGVQLVSKVLSPATSRFTGLDMTIPPAP